MGREGGNLELQLQHLQEICCEVLLFNRQYWQIGKGKGKRMITYFDGSNKAIYFLDLRDRREAQQLFSQIKLIRFNRKIIGSRLQVGTPLEVQEYYFHRMKKREKLLFESEKAYQDYLKKEKSNYRRC